MSTSKKKPKVKSKIAITNEEYLPSMKDVITDKAPLIRLISKPVAMPLSKEDKALMQRMIRFVKTSQDEKSSKKYNLRPAYGISAVQMNKAIRMFYVRLKDNFGQNVMRNYAFCNPKIIESSQSKGYLKSGEGCLSVEENKYEGFVHRPIKITVKSFDFLLDKEVEVEFKGLDAIVIQHEMDHLNGILFYDRINPLQPYYIEPKSAPI